MLTDGLLKVPDRAAAVGMAPVYLPFRDYNLFLAMISIVSAILLGTSISFGLYNLVRPVEMRNTGADNEKAITEALKQLGEQIKKLAAEQKEDLPGLNETMQEMLKKSANGTSQAAPSPGAKPAVTDTGVPNNPANAAAPAPADTSDGSALTPVPPAPVSGTQPAPSNSSRNAAAPAPANTSDGSALTPLPAAPTNAGAQPAPSNSSSSAAFSDFSKSAAELRDRLNVETQRRADLASDLNVQRQRLRLLQQQLQLPQEKIGKGKAPVNDDALARIQSQLNKQMKLVADLTNRLDQQDASLARLRQQQPETGGK